MSSSKASPSASAAASGSEPPAQHTVERMQGTSADPKEVLSIINSFKEQVAAERCIYVKKRMEENRLKLFDMSNNLYKLSLEGRNNMIIGSDKSLDLLTRRQKDAIYMQDGVGMSNGDKDSNDSQEDSYASSAILLGSSIAVKNAVRPIKLMEVKQLPPYTTWIFLDRNQRMTEDQSVVGRRRIYYDQNGGEALICTDSEEEIIEEEEEKKEFGESEDYVLRMTVKEAGLSDAVLDTLGQCLSRKPCEVKRYEPPSNILYRRDMKSLLRENILLRPLGIQFLIKILMQLSILSTTCFVVDVLSLIADCMDVPRTLFFLLRNNSLGAALVRKIFHVAHIAINWLLSQKVMQPQSALQCRLMLKINHSFLLMELVFNYQQRNLWVHLFEESQNYVKVKLLSQMLETYQKAVTQIPNLHIILVLLPSLHLLSSLSLLENMGFISGIASELLNVYYYA